MLQTETETSEVLSSEIIFKGRGMGREYIKIITLPDYPAAKKYMAVANLRLQVLPRRPRR